MSGICGQFNLDQSPVAKAQLNAITTMLEKHGPDAAHHWHGGPVGFGHSRLATIPELEFEKQPFRHEETGCVITKDVRLDYRRELLDALGRIDEHDSIGDAELILLAYLAWDEACLDRLLGDFAFAIWETRHQSVFCARDHFRIRPLYYHHRPVSRFIFASSPRATLVLPEVPYRISEGRMADYLVPQLEWIDFASTFLKRFSGCRRGFEEVFSQAIEERLRGPSNNVGSMLSGGMDSGTIVAIAIEKSVANGNGPLPTFSGARREGDDCAESRAIYSAIEMPSISPTLVLPDDIENTFCKLTASIYEPFDGEFTILKSIYLAARSKGRRILLDGAAGDIVLSEGSYLLRLIRTGHFSLIPDSVTLAHDH